MSDIKSVLCLLCQHLSLSIDVPVKPEHFRLAKFNNTAENVTEILWKILDLLSFYAVRETQTKADFREFDTLSAVKLCFAYLKYPVIEFYGLTETSDSNRQLLLAFGWLLGTQNILNTVVQVNLAKSALGRECSNPKTHEEKEWLNDTQKPLMTQINNIIQLNGKVNYNIKEIAELISVRTKLVAKVHDASINISGLPHISVSELALTKCLSTGNKDVRSTNYQKELEELSKIGSLIDTHLKWLKKEHIFFEWMVTVIEEHNKFTNANLTRINWQEVSKFISLLRHVIKRELETPSKGATTPQENNVECVSRLLRVQNSDTEVGNWLTKATVQLTEETEDLHRRKQKLSNELKQILQLIPSCVQV